MKDFYQKNYFFIRRLHSLSGIIPVGAFFMMHMLLNSRAFQGHAQYEWVPDTLAQIPFVMVIEVGGILVPILFHAILGAVIFWQGDLTGYSKTPYAGWYSNIAYAAQRLTGLFLFAGLIIHVWMTWGYKIRMEAQHALPENWIFPLMQEYMQSNGWRLFYFLLVVLSAYHFGNGIYNFLYKWGATTSKLSQRYAIAIGLLIGLIGATLGLASMYGLAFKDFSGTVHTALNMIGL